jgi:hypothetical protein
MFQSLLPPSSECRVKNVGEEKNMIEHITEVCICWSVMYVSVNILQCADMDRIQFIYLFDKTHTYKT